MWHVWCDTRRTMERFFPSRVIKMQYKLQNLQLQFGRKKKIKKKLNFFFFFFFLIYQKETSRAMERFFPSRVIKMQYKLQFFLIYFFSNFFFIDYYHGYTQHYDWDHKKWSKCMKAWCRDRLVKPLWNDFPWTAGVWVWFPITTSGHVWWYSRCFSFMMW